MNSTNNLLTFPESPKDDDRNASFHQQAKELPTASAKNGRGVTTPTSPTSARQRLMVATHLQHSSNYQSLFLLLGLNFLTTI